MSRLNQLFGGRATVSVHHIISNAHKKDLNLELEFRFLVLDYFKQNIDDPVCSICH